MKHFKVAGSPCPHCGVFLDGATNLDLFSTDAPEPGAFSVCAYCATFLRLDHAMRLVKLTPSDYQELLSEPEQMNKLIRMAQIIKQVQGKKVPVGEQWIREIRKHLTN